MKLKRRISYFFRDLFNRIRYGVDGPKSAELIWIDPEYINEALSEVGSLKPKYTGRVIAAKEFNNTVPVSSLIKISYCKQHWVEGESWSDVGAYDHLMDLIKADKHGRADGCKKLSDVIERYKKLDLLFEEIKDNGRLKSTQEYKENNFRESGGLIFHLGSDGQPIFGLAGYHRVAMAKILGLRVPAQLGCVHPNAVKMLGKYRVRNER